jgi:hypothetical protein
MVSSLHDWLLAAGWPLSIEHFSRVTKDFFVDPFLHSSLVDFAVSGDDAGVNV